MNNLDEHLLPCPFCGKDLNSKSYYTDINEILHPSGTVWRTIFDDGDSTPIIEYDFYKNREESDNLCYQINCPEIYGGCGAEMHGDSKDEVIAKWNTRVSK